MGDVLAGRIEGTPVFLAPMAGTSDLPFRRLALRFGATRVVSEMAASGELVHGKPSTRARTDLCTGHRGGEDDRHSVDCQPFGLRRHRVGRSGA